MIIDFIQQTFFGLNFNRNKWRWLFLNHWIALVVSEWWLYHCNHCRAGSESRDAPPGGWQSGRRASTSDIKGSGIRTGGNLVEPSVKSQNFCMPFGSSKSSGFVKKRGTKQMMNQSAQQITESKLQAKRERNRTISGETSSKGMKRHNLIVTLVRNNHLYLTIS